MNQLLLDFPPSSKPAFDAFLGQANAELLHVLQAGQAPFVYLWGEAGSGKSHLLRAWTAQAGEQGKTACYVDAAGQALDEDKAQAERLAVDQVECLDEAGQAALFNAFNRIRQTAKARCCSALRAPRPLWRCAKICAPAWAIVWCTKSGR